MDNAIKRRKTRELFIGPVGIGHNRPVSVQSMTNTATSDARATLRQIRALAKIGCEIIRVSVPDDESALALKDIVKGSPLPVVADIHFSHELALKAIDAGVQGLRLNPGNIRGRKRLERVVAAARERRLPVRVGVNAGSVAKPILRRFGGPTPEALVESALEHIRILEDLGHPWIKVSLKASDALETIAANRLLAATGDWPLHLGVTEAGTLVDAAIKSAVGIGVLLGEGIGDTIRVSIAGDPRREIGAAFKILRALRLRERGVELIACPTCARTKGSGLDVAKVATKLERALSDVERPLKIAVMGCVVNGPGEARGADLGVFGSPSGAVLMKAGRKVGVCPPEQAAETLSKMARELLDKG